MTTFDPRPLRSANPIDRHDVITKEQLERFHAFKGDMDKWALSQRNGRDEVLTGAEWTTIDKLVQRLKLEKNGFATPDYRGETERLMNKSLENADAKKFALGMV